MDRPPYVPAHYAATTVDGALVWGDGSLAGSLVGEARRALEALVEHRLARTLHLVVYATTSDACAALDRTVPSTMLLAPLHEPTRALIAAQSPAADPRNGDPARMRRLLCHELAHVFVAERTGSTKRLGDGDRGMRLAPWLDEGFAECAAAVLCDRPLRPPAGELTDAELDAAFRDLQSPARPAAFAAATARVWRMIESRGFPAVFAGLAG